MPRRPASQDIARPSSALLSGLRGISVATAHEALGRRGLMDPGVRPIVVGTHVVGPAITAWCAPDDNLAMHVALSIAQSDDILVIHSAAGSLGAQWGALVTHQATAIGLAGVVTDGSTRDVATIRELGFPVWAGHIAAWGTTKTDVVGVNVPVPCGGVVVNPGDIVVADDDGVLVIPIQEAERVLAGAVERDARERDAIERIQRGERLFDIMGFRDADDRH